MSTLADDRPVICLVDHVQWIDRESVEALMFVWRRFDGDRVAMTLALRHSDPDPVVARG